MTRALEAQLFRLAGVLALAAVALTVWVAVHGVPMPADVRIARAVQARGSFQRTADFINTAGSWNFVPFLAAGAIVLLGGGLRRLRWRAPRERREALYGFLAAIGVRYFDQLLKFLLESPRPTAAWGVRVDEIRDSYGFPSGHVYGDVVFYGVMAVYAAVYLPARLVMPARAVLLAVILLAGPARIFVGAHWPSDTAGGYLWGAAALCLAVGYGTWAGRATAGR